MVAALGCIPVTPYLMLALEAQSNFLTSQPRGYGLVVLKLCHFIRIVPTAAVYLPHNHGN